MKTSIVVLIVAVALVVAWLARRRDNGNVIKNVTVRSEIDGVPIQGFAFPTDASPNVQIEDVKIVDMGIGIPINP
jgi:hypothetical protein